MIKDPMRARYDEPFLTIGYSTLASRALAMVLPRHQPGVELLIVVQQSPPGFDLDLLQRPDVRVIFDDGIGAARSRNIVIDSSAGQYVLFGDDDVALITDGVEELLRVLERSPQLSFVQGRAVDETGQPRKRYPKRSVRLHRWNSAKIGTIELMIRRADVVASGVRFDERFGAGTTNYLGDEYVFIADALRSGLRGRFVPASAAVHPVVSSGSGGGRQDDDRARSVVFDRVFGWWAPLGRLLFLLRRPQRFGTVRRSLRFVLGGPFPAKTSPLSEPTLRSIDHAADRATKR